MNTGLSNDSQQYNIKYPTLIMTKPHRNRRKNIFLLYLGHTGIIYQRKQTIINERKKRTSCYVYNSVEILRICFLTV